jgi:hypothetical protein
MATWTLSPQHKKSAVERQYWSKDSKVIVREEGYRWGTFYCESEERPNVDLKNPDGYELGGTDYDWELDNLDDGCWADSEAGRNCTEQDLEEFDEAWEEDYFDGAEAKGWSNDDTEYWYYGPLELTNEDTGEVFRGDEVEETTEEPATISVTPGAVNPHTAWPFPINDSKKED